MHDQLHLLQETDWDVLLLLDACRADALRAITGLAETVRSPAVCTKAWLKAARGLMARRKPLHFCANPVCARENEAQNLGLRLVDVWRSGWAELKGPRVPGVHPFSVNGAVLTYRDLGRLDMPILVHYLGPHSPYIGEPPLALGRWGRGVCYLSKRCHALIHPDRAVREGHITWPEIRDAYMGDLRLHWDAVLQLARELKECRFVVTSDHGEMLGEEGKFGHEAGWRHDVLHEVPWICCTGKELAETAGSRQTSTQDKLEALGYA